MSHKRKKLGKHKKVTSKKHVFISIFVISFFFMFLIGGLFIKQKRAEVKGLLAMAGAYCLSVTNSAPSCGYGYTIANDLSDCGGCSGVYHPVCCTPTLSECQRSGYSCVPSSYRCYAVKNLDCNSSNVPTCCNTSVLPTPTPVVGTYGVFIPGPTATPKPKPTATPIPVVRIVYPTATPIPPQPTATPIPPTATATPTPASIIDGIIDQFFGTPTPTNSPTPIQSQQSEQNHQPTETPLPTAPPLPTITPTPLPVPEDNNNNNNPITNFFNAVGNVIAPQQQTQPTIPTPLPTRTPQRSYVLPTSPTPTPILTVRVKRLDGTQIELSDDALAKMSQILQNENLPQIKRISGNNYAIIKNDVQAETTFPLSIDLTDNTITVTTEGGERVIAITPDQAVQIVKSQKVANSIQDQDGVQMKLISYNGDPVYQLNGTATKRIFNLFNVPVHKTIYISAETGAVVKVDETPISQVVDALSNIKYR